MKQLHAYASVLAILFLAGIMLAGCSDDDSLAGTWHASSVASTACDDSADEFSLSFDGCTSTECAELQLNDDGTYSLSFDYLLVVSETDTGTWSETDATLELCTSLATTDNCETFTYTQNGSTLTLNGVGNNSGCTVVMVLERQ